MSKKLGRMLRPNMAYYFLFMLVFPVVALLMEQYLLALVGFAATALALVIYLLVKKYRRQWFIKYNSKSTINRKQLEELC